jgi:hypothetical protein
MTAHDGARAILAQPTQDDVPPSGTCCTVCDDLLAECGSELFPLYSKKLLIRGWAGRMSPVERRYFRRHRSGAGKRDAARRAERLRKVRFQPRNVNPQACEAISLVPDSTLGLALRSAGANAPVHMKENLT